MVNLKDIDMLNKLQSDSDDDDEPSPCEEVPIYNTRDSDVDSDVDSDDDNPGLNYESDD